MDEQATGPAERDRRPDVVYGQSWPPPQPTGPPPGQVQPYAEPQPYGQPPQPYGQPQQYGYPQPDHQARTAALIIGRKSPALAGILSLFVPGLGQFVNGAPVAGVLFLVGWLFNLPFVFLFGWLVVPVLVSFGLVVWSCIHAIVGANRHNDRLVAQALGTQR